MSTTTVRMKAADIYKDWHVIDAAGRPLGRIASEAAHLLRGKHKPTFEPHLDCGDFVIVINASHVRVGGKKAQEKMYYRHSGFPGGLKARSFEQQLAFRPERIIEEAVWGMLPSGPLGKAMLKHMKVYRGPAHPHQSQIAGTERARTEREAGVADLIKAADAKKPPRLRPLAVPMLLVHEMAELEDEPEVVVVPEPAPEPAPAPRRRRAAAIAATPAAADAATPESEASE